MVSKREWYERVNGTWPDIVPRLEEEEALRAARRLYRFVKRRTWTGPTSITTGNRYTRVLHGELMVNPERGWKELVHDLSHWLAPHLRHGGEHARLEARMIREVLRRGWLEGKLKPAPKESVPDGPPPVDERIERRRAQIARLERKVKALSTRIKTATRSLRALERVAQRRAQ